MAIGIYDRVPCTSLSRSKFNLSHRSSFTGDMGIIYPTMVEEAIDGDVWKCGSEHVLQFMPLISPMLQNVKIDKHAFFIPFRLMYENWTKFFMMKDNHGNEYTTPLPSLKDLLSKYTAEDAWHDLYRYINTMTDPLYSVYYMATDQRTTKKPSEVTTALVNTPSNVQNEVLSYFDHFDPHVGTLGYIVNCAKACLPFCCGNLLDMLGFPVFDEQFHDKFGVCVVPSTPGSWTSFKVCLFDKSVDKWVDATDGALTINFQHCTFTSNGSEHQLAYWLRVYNKEYISCAPVLSYWYVFDEWYRRSDVDDMFKCKWLRNNELGVSDDEYEIDANNPAWLSFVPHTRTYHKDYFTATLKTAQSGTAPALPISGILPAFINGYGDFDLLNMKANSFKSDRQYPITDGDEFSTTEGPMDDYQLANYGYFATDLSTATTFDITDLRLANAIQRFQELSNVAGTRYTTFLKMMYGTSPNDDVLQRPDYFGHIVSSVKFGQVESSVATDDDPLGTRAGKGNSVDVGYFRAYHPKEPGIILTTMSMVPESTYSGQGIPRMWQRKSRYDYYDPRFAGIGEQEVKTSELFLSSDDPDHVQDSILGFIGRFDEYKSRVSNCKGLMRNSKYNTFTLDRYFVNTPSLNSDFVHVKVPKGRFLAVPTEPTFICYFGNIAHVYRPIPEYSVPRL